ncbi:hypothetical protein [Hespellia stercorisuis]|uniref:hypothetical protein n=1 Tax=Hespellia stercorisuis TaxID=180311 RepID=UPI0013563D87|nr:hypothetical protein [Hespellia stercorisuis]
MSMHNDDTAGGYRVTVSFEEDPCNEWADGETLSEIRALLIFELKRQLHLG